MKPYCFALLTIILASLACDAVTTTPVPVSQVDISTAVAATFFAAQAQTQAAAPIVVPTNKPASAPISTDTSIATDTPLPPTPTTAPIVLKGSGDSVVDVQKGNQPAIAKITYNGSDNFAIQNYDDNNTQIDLLVNTIGSYQGTVPLDFMKDEHTIRFQVTASGPWEIQILPIVEARHEAIPGNIQGTGDDVVYLDGKNPDTLTVDASEEKDNFAIWSFDGTGVNLLVNEIAPYTGTVVLDHSTFILIINAVGKWTLNITTK